MTRVGVAVIVVQQLDLIGRGEVELDRTLVGVQIREHRTAFWPTTVADERSHHPGGATTRAFDLDHLAPKSARSFPQYSPATDSASSTILISVSADMCYLETSGLARPERLRRHSGGKLRSLSFTTLLSPSRTCHR